MTRVIPGIQTANIYDLQQKLDQAQEFTNIIHIDISDGVFVSSETINPYELKMVRTTLSYNLHLMAKLDKDLIQSYAATDAENLIIYKEACDNFDDIVPQIRLFGRNVGLALDISIQPEKYKDILDKVDFIVVMAVETGFSGQKFRPEVLSKIKKIKKMRESLDIGVDGGIAVGTASEAAKSGADFVVANSAIWDAEIEPKEAYQRLVENVKI